MFSDSLTELQEREAKKEHCLDFNRKRFSVDLKWQNSQVYVATLVYIVLQMQTFVV